MNATASIHVSEFYADRLKSEETSLPQGNAIDIPIFMNHSDLH